MKGTAVLAAVAFCLGFLWAQAASGQTDAPQIKITHQDDNVVKYERTYAAQESPSFWRSLFSLFRVQPDPTKIALPFKRSVALLVGIGNYKYLTPRLEYVSRDVQKMREYLLTTGGFDTVYVMDESTTPELVESYMMYELKKLDKDDRLMFYYSGHGGDAGGGHAYLQFQQFQPGHWNKNVLRVDDFQVWSDVIPARHILFIYDACFAGLALATKSGAEDARSSIAEVSANGSRTVVTAGTAEQQALMLQASSDNRSSVFTDALLASLSDGKADTKNRGFVTIEQAVANAQVEMVETIKRSVPGHEMKPEIRAINPTKYKGSFVFLDPAVRNPTLSTEDRKILGLPKGESTEPAVCHVAATSGTPLMNPVDGLQYVLIPAGDFRMGCVPSDPKCSGDERPQHGVTITKFYMTRTEVTVAAYRRYTTATGHAMPDPPDFDEEWKDLDQPIVNVTWAQANAFCRWAAGETGRLPTEAEWERAARGGEDDSIYVWGNAVSHENANFDVGRERKPVKSVCQFPPNGFGLYDIAGNVSEWTSDWYALNSYAGYDSGTPFTYPSGAPENKYRAVRGGSWQDEAQELRTSARSAWPPWKFDPSLGFRCATDDPLSQTLADQVAK